jgi:hypothetical protein
MTVAAGGGGIFVKNCGHGHRLSVFFPDSRSQLLLAYSQHFRAAAMISPKGIVFCLSAD